MREGDVVVRYGGEEFVVIAPATDGAGAVHAAERIRSAVAAASSEPVDGHLVPLTISAGVASLVDETDGRGLFRAADSALLAAKRAGRDRVTQKREDAAGRGLVAPLASPPDRSTRTLRGQASSRRLRGVRDADAQSPRPRRPSAARQTA